MNKFICILIAAVMMGGLFGCSPPPVSPAPTPTLAPSACTGQAFVVGDLSDNPVEVIKGDLPLAMYLAEHLADFGYVCGKVNVPDTLDKMIAYIKNGEVDIYQDSMYPAALVSEATGAQPILRRWRNCDPDYYSVIFTTKDGDITKVEDLPGHMVAMDMSYSTSGFALPAILLLDRGLHLSVKDSYDAPVAENEVGIYFSGADENTLNLVLESKVSAGATDDFYFTKWEKEAQGKLAKLAETESMPRQAVLVRAGLESDLQEAIKIELAGAHLNPTGLAILKQAADTCKFDEPPEGIEAVFAKMQAMHGRLSKIPGWQKAFESGH